jgi:GAF domain-containing protein
MPAETDRFDDLTTLVQITEILNQSVDVQAMLTSTLAKLLELMGLETGWIFLADPAAQDSRWGPGFVLAANHNLPPALALGSSDAWTLRRCAPAIAPWASSMWPGQTGHLSALGPWRC